MEMIKNFIGGELVEPVSGEYLDNYSPMTGAVYSKVPNSGKEDIDKAALAAKKAFPIWSKMSPKERADRLFHLADLIEENADRLAKAESIDQGKPLWLAKSVDIPRGSQNLRYFAHAIQNQKSVSFTDIDGILQYINRIPIGPSALISPWNLPLYLITWKIAPCLAAGNTAICKPSELTPMTAFLLSELATQVDFPPGTLNIIHGLGQTTGEALITHPDVPVISFTGGTKTGAHISETVGPMFKKMSLELGGKNPNIIFDDCDFEKAIGGSIRASFLNQGEICLCGSRMFVQKGIFDKFVSRFVEETEKLQVGDPFDESSFIGALVSKDHLDKVLGYVELAKEEGGKVLTSREVRGLKPEHQKGYFMRPTVITGLAPNCRVQQEEIFGPVVVITPFETEEEVLSMANGVDYGLSASLWTQDISKAHRVARNIQSGTVWINSWMYRDLRVPLGGMKSSGIGREGGDYSLNFFTETQNVCVQF
ncbi:MAG: aldehyde dehydrogenase [Bdellovibrionales bacterium]|nr:aldehyde dehydrogenase [Bdellovibrionales bacterium]